MIEPITGDYAEPEDWTPAQEQAAKTAIYASLGIDETEERLYCSLAIFVLKEAQHPGGALKHLIRLAREAAETAGERSVS
ncbi:MAG: hypothetical protein LBQ75_08815 [Zoogloeaceae bacterium]|jgi:hypothetical protein|nr:hypothetical protein [Zoogloeaceae bacterium]